MRVTPRRGTVWLALDPPLSRPLGQLFPSLAEREERDLFLGVSKDAGCNLQHVVWIHEPDYVGYVLK